MIKRYLFIICALTFGILILSGCSEQNEQQNSVNIPSQEKTEIVTEKVTPVVSETVTITATPAHTETESLEEAYKILVTDINGQPVEGAMVQFCSDVMCIAGKTGPDGIAEFKEPAGKYEVHILRAPKGYASDDNVYETEEKFGTLNIVLNIDV